MRQNSLRSLFLLTAILSCLLAWRAWDPARAVVKTIQDSGGTVYRRYQCPEVCRMTSKVKVYRDTVNFWPSEIRLNQKRSRTAAEFLFGAKALQNVTAVKLPVPAVSATLLDQINQLNHLEIVYIELPGNHFEPDSNEVQQYDNVRHVFGDLVFPKETRGSAARE